MNKIFSSETRLPKSRVFSPLRPHNPWQIYILDRLTKALLIGCFCSEDDLIMTLTSKVAMDYCVACILQSDIYGSLSVVWHLLSASCILPDYIFLSHFSQQPCTELRYGWMYRVRQFQVGRIFTSSLLKLRLFSHVRIFLSHFSQQPCRLASRYLAQSFSMRKCII